jgi:pimeloyl-ACP methyl ester carboxylesterase
MRWLIDERGVEKVVLLGNSGGGSLLSYYQAQATAAPADRIRTTPGGRPTLFARTEMPPGHAMIFMAAHAGQGLVVNETIDASVMDEDRPLLTDLSLDMYAPDNGFQPPPRWTRYESSFVERYRAGQAERVRRLDARARAMIAEARRAEELHADPDFGKLPLAVQRDVLARETFEPVMVIYRTMANLHYVDRSLDPSNRGYGSLLSERPDLMNFQHRGFARVQTPHAWLSTWSGLSSNANALRNAPKLTVPGLVIHAGRDLDVFPETHSRPIYESLGSTDKEYWDFPDALHYFEADEGESGTASLDTLMARLVPWIEQRFPL